MNCRQGRIGTIFFSLFEVRCLRTFRSRKNLELIGGFVESELERVTARFPLPAAKGDEACAAHKLRGVILDDVVRATTGHEPPDDHLAATHWTINRRHFEDVELRSPVTTRIPDG